ncbi:LmeA family phospholipid-binding protein [Nocardia sp. NPDC048505]|uniref:LmeA family phospholipid-binding protein n=1 Tax=Nocardia sp. NPDC048505 TaxID=3155756 RepID=UPI0033C219B2
MRKLIIGLLVLAGLAVVVDFTAAAYSEYRVSRALRAGADLTADPEVTIHGFPFLGQAMDGVYSNVDIRARYMRPDIPGEISVEANLRGARLPFSELADGNVRQVPVDRVTAKMRVEPVELGRLFKIPDLQVHTRPADKSDGTGGSGGSGMTTAGALVLTGTLPSSFNLTDVYGKPLGGQNVKVKADLVLDGDQVKIVATGFYIEKSSDPNPSARIPDVDQAMVLERFTHTIDTKELPFGMEPKRVYALGGQIVVEGEAENTVIDLDRLQRP